MWDHRGHSGERAGRLRPSTRACIAAYLVVLLGLGDAFNVCGPVAVNWLPFASGSVPTSEETTDAELPALHTSPCLHASRHHTSAQDRPVHAERDGHPPSRRGSNRLDFRGPDLPCGAVVPIRC